MIKRLIIGFALMLLSSAAFSFSLSDYNGRCGNTRIQLGPTYGKHAVADAFHNTITIDPITVRKFSPRAVEFIFFHECGHIKYGHQPAAYGTTNYQQREDDADCYAANRFKRTYGKYQMTKALEELAPLNGEVRTHKIQQCK